MKKILIGTAVVTAFGVMLSGKLARSADSLVSTQNVVENYGVENFSSGRSRANGNRAAGSSLVKSGGCSVVLRHVDSWFGLDKCQA
ncbi:hypothetical protein L1285_14810 [Pseudoalteromonas sp. DL2-H2.2]|uniref:hypothetical protein n=1 Tax=Pseudoalteromonas sp. DL2-H2.2 TaxID=2908889 RepID=UPI001F3BFAD2|nr:hypothetical protein [Pseudoalteromonas sp. DL2-H2.2]MCF2909594.1 hypothetical protein [Pseudoalteromonas sp. DL2-H2.2]